MQPKKWVNFFNKKKIILESFNTRKSYDNTQFRADLTNYIEEYEKNSTNQVFSYEKIVEKKLFIKEGYLEKENKISMEVVNEDLEYHELGKIKSDDSRSFYYKYEDSLKDSRKNSHLVWIMVTWLFSIIKENNLKLFIIIKKI